MSLMALQTATETMTKAMGNISDEFRLFEAHGVGWSSWEYLDAITGWQLAATILIILITYDQGMSFLRRSKEYDGSDIAQ